MMDTNTKTIALTVGGLASLCAIIAKLVKNKEKKRLEEEEKTAFHTEPCFQQPIFEDENNVGIAIDLFVNTAADDILNEILEIDMDRIELKELSKEGKKKVENRKDKFITELKTLLAVYEFDIQDIILENTLGPYNCFD